MLGSLMTGEQRDGVFRKKSVQTISNFRSG